MTTASTSNVAANPPAHQHGRLNALHTVAATDQTTRCELFDLSTAARSAAALRLQAECPALLDLNLSPGLPPFDPVQALALHELLSAMTAVPKVLEIGNGPWAAILAALTLHRDGGFWSIGIDAWRTHSLAHQLKGLAAGDALHLSTTNLVRAQILGMEGRFPNLDILGNEADFNLIFVSADEAVREAASLLHAMPAVAAKVAVGGFTVCVNGGSVAMHEVAAHTWGYLADDLAFIEGGCAGLGLLVSAG